MIFGETGHVGNGVYVLGLPWTPSYLLDCPAPVLFEAGFSCAGRLYEEDARKVLKGRTPQILFLTHVHYDHCGATAYFKEVFPGIKVAASPIAAELIKRPNAQKLIRTLSAGTTEEVASLKGIDSTRVLRAPFEPFDVDIMVEDGQIVTLAEDISVEVISTAGHTRDQVSYYIPQRKALIATESVGSLDRIGQILPAFLVNFELYVTNLKRLSLLDVEVLCLGHHYVVTSPDVKAFFEGSIKGAEQFGEKVKELLAEEQGSIDRVMTRIKAEEYDTNPGPKQIEQAYLINLRARVTHLAKWFDS